jgi:hypothetical protein
LLLSIAGLALAASGPVRGQADDRIIGLLTLPEVFGRGPCEKFLPEPVTLLSDAGSGEVVGTIRVDRNWTLPECHGLTVNVHPASEGKVSELPTREYSYEAPAAIVLDQRDGWFKIRLSDGSAWVRASSRDEFLSLDELLRDGLTYLTGAWDGRLAPRPGGDRFFHDPAIRGAKERTGADGPSVRFVGSRELNGDVWLEIEVVSGSVCTAEGDPTVVGRGWVPAHSPSGEPTVWFYSRGC